MKIMIVIDSLQYWQFLIRISESENEFCGPHSGAICTLLYLVFWVAGNDLALSVFSLL